MQQTESTKKKEQTLLKVPEGHGITRWSISPLPSMDVQRNSSDRPVSNSARQERDASENQSVAFGPPGIIPVWFHLTPLGVGVAGELFRMPREDVERLPGKLIEIRFVFVVRRHQRLFDEIIEGASQLGDGFPDVVGPHGYHVFFWSGQ